MLPVGVAAGGRRGKLAALMSTASACLLASSTIALEDVLPAIRRKLLAGCRALHHASRGHAGAGIRGARRVGGADPGLQPVAGGMPIPLAGRSSGRAPPAPAPSPAC
ncbi:hypothetical protein M8494_17115 [Serratia ureilytica]